MYLDDGAADRQPDCHFNVVRDDWSRMPRFVEVLPKMVHQRRNIRLVLPKRRQFDLEHVEFEIEILQKGAGALSPVPDATCRRDNSYVGLDGLAARQSYLVIPQQSKDSWTKGNRHFANLLQETTCSHLPPP
jgi:hypothetical protein